MKYSVFRSGAMSVIALLALCAAVQAQGPTGSLAEVSQVTRPGQRIEVARKDGSVVTGDLIRASEAGLMLDVEGEAVDLPASVVAEVSRRGDSLTNGLIIGGISGTVVFFGFAVTGGGDWDDSSPVASFALLCVGGGLGLGALFDGIFEKKTVLFRAASAPPIAFVPILTRNRKGVALRLRF